MTDAKYKIIPGAVTATSAPHAHVVHHDEVDLLDPAANAAMAFKIQREIKDGYKVWVWPGEMILNRHHQKMIFWTMRLDRIKDNLDQMGDELAAVGFEEW